MSFDYDLKAGKLPVDRLLYYKKKGNSSIKEASDQELYYLNLKGFDIEILGVVPSYEEYQQLKDENFDLKHWAKTKCGDEPYCQRVKDLMEEVEAKNKHLLDLQANQDKEIESLRELLKECETCVELSGININPKKDYAKDLLTRINAAIGESEE